jgi:hypothetical protein
VKNWFQSFVFKFNLYRYVAVAAYLQVQSIWVTSRGRHKQLDEAGLYSC